MLTVAAGWTQLGTRHVNAVPGVDLGALVPGPGSQTGGSQTGGSQTGGSQTGGSQGPAAHGKGGAARALGAPPALLSPMPGSARAPILEADLPARRAWVRSFRIDRTEVTRAAYSDFLRETGYRLPQVDEDWAREGGWIWTSVDPPQGTADHPVVLVSWYDASEFCHWRGARLPTEAEWQLAALGPLAAQRIFPWGNSWGDLRINHGQIAAPNFDDVDGFLRTSPVASFPAGRSEAGLEDSFGNAWEFTSDRRVFSWDQVRHTDIEGGWADVRAPMPGLTVAVRGGSYYFDFRINPGGERHAFLPELRRKTSGLRCAADLP